LQAAKGGGGGRGLDVGIAFLRRKKRCNCGDKILFYKAIVQLFNLKNRSPNLGGNFEDSRGFNDTCDVWGRAQAWVTPCTY